MSPTKVAIVLQARIASTRFPGKALRGLAGQPLLGMCIARLSASGIAPIVVATSTDRNDDRIANAAAAFGVQVIRGPHDDVLERYALAAEQMEVGVLIRATADNPLVDIDAPGRVLHAIEAERADYVVERDLPHGAAVEVVRASALLVAAAEATRPYDREHVTSFIRERPERFRVCTPSVAVPLRRPDLRFTVDTPDDLAYLHTVLERAGAHSHLVPLATLIKAADGSHGMAEAA